MGSRGANNLALLFCSQAKSLFTSVSVSMRAMAIMTAMISMMSRMPSVQKNPSSSFIVVGALVVIVNTNTRWGREVAVDHYAWWSRRTGRWWWE